MSIVVWAISGSFTPAGQHTRGPLVMIRPLDHAYAACIGEPADAEWNPYGHYWIQNGPDPQMNPSPSPYILHPEASCGAPPPDSPPLAP